MPRAVPRERAHAPGGSVEEIGVEHEAFDGVRKRMR